MLDLFKIELETNSEILTNGLLKLESNPSELDEIESLMRAAHSLKGAAKILQLEPFVNLSHEMENVFVAVQESKYSLTAEAVDQLLQAVDFYVDCSKEDENNIPVWLDNNEKQIGKSTSSIKKLLTQKPKKEPAKKVKEKSKPVEKKVEEVETKKEVVDDIDEAAKLLLIDEDVKDIDKVEKVEEKAIVKSTLDIDLSMVALFKVELENQSGILNKGLLTLENDPGSIDEIEQLMRASHSIKGAAKILGFDSIVSIAHLMEDFFVSLQEEKINLVNDHIDVILSAVDLFSSLAEMSEEAIVSWISENGEEIARVTLTLTNLYEITPTSSVKEEKKEVKREEPKSKATKLKKDEDEVDGERVLRVSAENLNKLVGLAGESLVDSKNLQAYVGELFKIKNSQNELSRLLEKAQALLLEQNLEGRIVEYVNEAQEKILNIKNTHSSFISDFEIFSGKSSNLSNRLYREVLLSRMRPFKEGANDFPRMVRDLGRQLNKKINLVIEGSSTKVDRDILEKLKAPLTHLIRNACDHGVEFPDERASAGKPEEGTLVLSASHRAGMLFIQLKDDGGGINIEKIKKKIVDKNYVTEDMAKELTDSEVTDFLFLPGFSTSQKVTDISGRGVGLDVVQNMIQDVGGIVRVESDYGKGTTFNLQLPITLSVIRTLIMEIINEPYAIPLTRIEYAIKIKSEWIQVVEGKQYFEFNGEKIGLLKASQILGKYDDSQIGKYLFVVVVSDRVNKYGLVVDKLLGERDLVVHRLDPRLGKVKDISAASILENGEPILIFDIEDLVKSVEDILSGEGLSKLSAKISDEGKLSKKKVLVVDDSITVREVEKKILEGYGYDVQVAVNGMDGWNIARSNYFDLVISDIDMPRMNGFEFVTLLKKNEKTKDIPVIIVSYKDREEDKIKGMEAGANYYLTKSSFHDDTFIEAVQDLIGEAE